MDPNSRKTHRKTVKQTDNLSKRCHYQTVQPILDCNLTFLVVQASSVLNPTLNNCPSSVSVTMDFSIVAISLPFKLINKKYLNKIAFSKSNEFSINKHEHYIDFF